MAKYTVTRACGHEETIVLFGKSSDREWRLDNVEPNKLCSVCWQKKIDAERAEETRLAVEEASESGLPELVGTEKQISWAERIRIQLLGDLDGMTARTQQEPEKIDAAVKSIQQKTSASWWIDHRDYSGFSLAKMLQKELDAITTAQSQPPRELVQEASAEATVRPEEPKTETPAEIRLIENIIEVHFPERRDDFRDVMKKLHTEWSGTCWHRKMTWKAGMSADRAAEAGHRLLAAGFVIRIFDADIRAKAIAGDYEPECTRWIARRKDDVDYAGWFSIIWDRHKDDLYKAAKRLPGARYCKPNVVAPSTSFEDVFDFARMYDFSLTVGAHEAAEKARCLRDAALIVRVEPIPEQEKETAFCHPPILVIPTEVQIADEFRD